MSVSLMGFFDVSPIISRSSEGSFVSSAEHSCETWIVPRKKSPLKMVFQRDREKGVTVSPAACEAGRHEPPL